MKMKFFIKKVSSLLLITMLLFTLCSCKKDTGNWDSGSIYTGDMYYSDVPRLKTILYNSGCTYDLAEDGTLTFSYENGKYSSVFPVKIPKVFTDHNTFCSVYISTHKIAVAYLDKDYQFHIAYSDDMGKTWIYAQSITPQELTGEGLPVKFKLNTFSHAWMGFTSEYNGWIILASNRALGREWHALYTTKDGK